MSYTITFKKSASKQLRKLPKAVLANVASAVDDLANEPRPDSCKKLKGTDDVYRIRVGDYRVLYTVDDSIITVEVIKVGNRKDVYD
ncbi:MAG: type II toxin-antitoxin system RelE/ParE family toxin [Spirosoma sp.]|nr:type II toxin-antitoxin system RelE/ParE family toxin [Spirosoma sp.]